MSLRSPKFPELVMSSHGGKETLNNEAEVWKEVSSLGPPEPQGVCLVWNMKYKKESPEYIFTSESPLVSARYLPSQ